jgi:hypothetical protein
MQFELKETAYDAYMKKLGERKGIVEERILGEEFRSPSVQLRVTPLGAVELLSTHDQLLGGLGQSYWMRLPGRHRYAGLITRKRQIGKRLQRESWTLCFGFVVVRSNGKWEYTPSRSI